MSAMSADRRHLIPARATPDWALAPRVRTLTGIELAALGECFNQILFLGALWFIGLSTATAALFLPLRDSATNGRPPASALIAVVVLLVLVAAAIRWAGAAYRAVRRWPRLEFALVLVSALLLSVATPLRNELWWPACAILMLLATLAPIPRAMAYCLTVLTANLAAHVTSGTIHDVSTVTILGLWIGLPFWTATAAIIPERLAAFVMRLNVARSASATLPPRRVLAWTDDDASTPPVAEDKDGARRPPPDVSTAMNSGAFGTTAPDEVPRDVGERLTSRQLQISALVATGLRYREIGECLSISTRQVHRHIANAVERLEVANVNELVSTLVQSGILAELDAEYDASA